MTAGDGRSTPLEAAACEKGQLPADEEVSGKSVANCCFLASACGNPSRNPDAEKPANGTGNDVTKDPALLQYLYVQSPAGEGSPCGSHTMRAHLCPSHSQSPQTKDEAPVLCSTATGVMGYILNALHFI